MYDACRMNILEAPHDLVDDKFHLMGEKGLKSANNQLFLYLHTLCTYVQADRRTDGTTFTF